MSPQIPHMPGAQGYAVVSCHVERALDDHVWRLYTDFIRRRPGGFTVASLLRPPADGETGAEQFAERARAAADLGPFGHHTHWTSPTHARPTGGDPAARVLEEGAWLRAQGLEPRFFCGGNWFMDRDVFTALADLAYTDCTATASRPAHLAPGVERIELESPARVVLPDGRSVLEVPTTHSVGAVARLLARGLPRAVHVHFHDYELLDRRRARLLGWVLAALALRRRPADLREIDSDREVPWDDVWAG
jgi:hypothetical protein